MIYYRMALVSVARINETTTKRNHSIEGPGLQSQNICHMYLSKAFRS
jgi:hypothetical protein